jgi:hypothetical protein
LNLISPGKGYGEGFYFPPDLSSLHDNKQHDSMVHILLFPQASPISHYPFYENYNSLDCSAELEVTYSAVAIRAGMGPKGFL